MNNEPAPSAGTGEEISALVSRLVETEQRLQELTAGEVDTILDPTGRSYLLRHAQQKLLQSEAAQRLLADTQVSILDALPANICLIDSQGIILSVNKGWRHFGGANALQDSAFGVGQNYLEICERAQHDPATEMQGVAAGIRSVLSGKVKKFEVEYPCHSPTEQAWFRLLVTPLDESYPAGAVVMHLDITERKRTLTRFRRLVDSNAQGVFFWKAKGEISGSNDAFLNLVRYTRDDLAAGRLNWIALTPPEFAHLDERALKQVAASGSCMPYEKEYICKDGTRVPILIGAAKFEDNPDEGVCFVLDLTERKKLEQQYRHAQKMESIGTLASGVAHDFNNILAVIMLHADLLRSEEGLSPKHRDAVKEIGNAAQLAANLTRQLLLFSRQQPTQMVEIELNETINNMTKMLRRILGEQMQIQFKFALQSLFINADVSMINQVLMNLTVNSRDAMPNGGTLVMETAGVEFDESAALVPPMRPGSFVCLKVSDSGSGIPPEILPKIFEPFFTTKAIGKGSGLGLATIFGIVQQHQGWISVSSEVGKGTTFKIYLPRMAKTTGAKSAKPASTTAPPGGHETILLVEDDAAVRGIVRKGLLQFGYRVLEASSGVQALEVWNQHRDEIHLLLTDLVMPGGMTGKDLAKRLLQDNPKLKVIYASGYANEVAARDLVLTEGSNYLTKPFEAHKLAKTVRDRLDANT
jgi:PAS domain S-box-containing protein